MRSATVSALAALALIGLAGCDRTNDEPAAVTITETVTHEPAPVVDSGPRDPEFCKQLEAQKSINKRLTDDGYADSYGAEYDQLLDANGC